MAFDETLADRIRVRLTRRKNIEEKRMFGGIVFFLNGNMLVGVWKDSLIVRLGQDQGDDALLEHCWSHTSRRSTSPAGR